MPLNCVVFWLFLFKSVVVQYQDALTSCSDVVMPSLKTLGILSASSLFTCLLFAAIRGFSPQHHYQQLWRGQGPGPHQRAHATSQGWGEPRGSLHGEDEYVGGQWHGWQQQHPVMGCLSLRTVPLLRCAARHCQIGNSGLRASKSNRPKDRTWILQQI